MFTRLSARQTWMAVTALYAGLALIYAWPLLLSMGTALPSDTGDPGLVSWILWWNAHAVPLTERWWDAPVFFPMKGAFALSETFLGVAPLTTPLQWLGASSVVAYNAAFLLSIPAAALAAHALARRLTGRHDVALIAGLAFGFSPYRASQMPHLQLLWSCWMPLGLLALHRYITTHRRRDLALLAVCWLFNGLATGYFLIFFAVLSGLWLFWFARTRWEWTAIGATLLLASLPIAPLLVGYQRHQAALGLSRGGGEIEDFSADLSGVLAASPNAWLPNHWSVTPRPEGELYPGAAIAILVIVGAIAAWRAQPDNRRSRTQMILIGTACVIALAAAVAWMTGGWRLSLLGVELSINHPHKILTPVVWLGVAAILCDRRIVAGWRRRSTFLFYVMAAAVTLFLALGPTPRVFGARVMYKAPYSWLMELPGGHALRVPARFGVLFALCLGQAAAIALSRVTRRGASAGLITGVAVVVALEGWVPKLPMVPVPSSIDLAGLDPGAAVVELPLGEIYGDTAAMLRATRHGHPLVNGFSGYAPLHYGLLIEGLRTFDTGTLPAMAQFGSLLVVVDSARDPDGRYRELMDHTSQATRVRDTPIGPVYALPELPATPSHDADHALTVSRVEVSGNDNLAGAMTDGLVTTRWYGPKLQAPGDRVVITLDRAANISAIELDMGSFGGGYPRQLRVAVADTPSASPVTVWEGGTAGPAVLATFKDFVRTPLTIDLPAGTRGQQIVLTLLADDLNVAWSIAEIRILGRP